MEDDIERFENFEFISPDDMVDDDLKLIVLETCPYNPKNGFVPEYKFAMIHAKTNVIMGTINLRVGLTERLKEFGGHIGYEVSEPYRGHRYAARSCKLLFPLIRRLGINPVVITCDPRNLASVRTIESIGAAHVATKEVQVEPQIYRPTNIYHLYLQGESRYANWHETARWFDCRGGTHCISGDFNVSYSSLKWNALGKNTRPNVALNIEAVFGLSVNL